ncbi:MAG: amidohydrolase family protein [Fimbriimonadaceae bacterium]|nr:amidohydrolase family protein [Fimbriimonadaceae bacterium]
MIKRTLFLGIFAAMGAMALADGFPFELEAHRKPKTVTNGNCLIRGARVLTATKGVIEKGDILVRNGKIEAIGPGLRAPGGFKVIEAEGKVVAPGIIDAHSHRASDGTNEGADSITAEVRIGDVLNLSALNVWQALASGHTSALILHGSANAVGGQSQVIKYKYNRPAEEAVVPDAPRMIKFALGENVTRKGGSTANTTRFPRSRMGVEALYRRAFTEAREYRAAWDAYDAKKAAGEFAAPLRRDLRLETLADILRGKVWVQCHSYRSDEMLMMVRLSQEFGFKIGAMQHALEAYKIAPELAAAGVGVSIFVDNWSFKQEGYDSIPFNAAICAAAGVNVSINTDGLAGTTALNIDAAKTMRFGGFTEEQALRTVTINPAKELGIDHRTGSIEVGKDADLVLWDGHPLSVYSRCAMTLVEGEVYFERRDAFGVDRSSTTKTVLDAKSNKAEAALPPKAKAYAIVGATVHRVSGPTIVGGTVLVRDGRIEAVGERVPIPADATRIEGAGLHVYPGFIDAGTTIGLSEISGINVMVDNAEMGSFQPDLDALTALWVESAHYGPARYNGVTNVFTRPTGGIIAGQGAMIHTDGYTVEQFGLQRKAALYVNLPGGAARFGPPDLCCDVVDASWLLGLGGSDPVDAGHDHAGKPTIGTDALTDEQLRAFYDMLGGAMPQQPPAAPQTGPTAGELDAYLDKALAYFELRKKEPSTPTDLRYEAMGPYLRGERPVVLTARNAASIRNAVAFAKKYKLKAILAGATEAWKEAALLKEAGIPVLIPPAGESTLGANTPDNAWDPYDTPYAIPGLLAKAGVKFAFQSGSSSETMNLPCRVGQSCAYGLKPEDALRALTLSAAEIFGVADRIGSIDAGKVANLIVTDGDPFEMTSTVRYAFIEGTPRSMSTKHTMLRDKYLGRDR